jgi:uncharacterized Fe-S cluster-containing protein
MNQTAVEYLYQELLEAGKDKFIWQIILQQAKEIEKEQIIDSFLDGYKSHPYLAEQYYKENYEKK